MRLSLPLIFTALHSCWGSSGIQSGKASDFYVADLPGLAPGTVLPEMHAGLIEVGSHLELPETSLFFWHVRSAVDTKTTVIWLNGGPGCSSMDGFFLEIGPLKLGRKEFGQDPKLLYNSEESWADVANLLFVDQPFGTGYSDPEGNTLLASVEDAARAFAVFLTEYVSIFPEIADTKIIIAGESFAGQYIPHIWHYLRHDEETWLKIKGLQGALLGNPWVDPANQYLSIPEFVRERHLIPDDQMETLMAKQDQCVQDLQNTATQNGGKIPFQSDMCEDMMQYVIAESFSADPHKCFNVYDIALESQYPSCGMEWPPGVDSMKNYLSRADVRQALHAQPQNGNTWEECSLQVHNTLKTGESAQKIISTIMETAPLMLMIGDNDFICNGKGQDRFVKNLMWNGVAGFTEDSELVETEYGTWRSERNLTMVHVTNASHMVPFDQPELSKELLMLLVGLEVSSSPRNTTLTGAPTTSDEEINKAVYRAYGRASAIALVVVSIFCLILFIIWWRRGQCLSCKGFLNALLHLPTRIKPGTGKRSNPYVPLQTFNKRGGAGAGSRRTQRPDVIIEEDEEEEENFEV